MQPRGLLFDYGGTLVEETSLELRAGNEWLLGQAAYCPRDVSLADVLARSERVTREVAARRDVVHIETPWASLTRLIHEPLGVRFDRPMSDLELGFWRASVTTTPMPGVREALARLHALDIPFGVVSNSSFGAHVIRTEIGQHGLADHAAFVMVSADYAVRKPNVLLFEVAAARLGVAPRDIWFMGDRLDTDIAGAKAAGMTAVWFNPSGADGGHDADRIVSSWAALVDEVIREGSEVA
jgi:putative hydrolase of the HAD superfamily